MKLHDYETSQIKNEIRNSIDSHDTQFGAFCKGISFAKSHMWIREIMPEEFSDLVDGNRTKDLPVKYVSGKIGVCYRQKVGKDWEWKNNDEKIDSWSGYVYME